MRRFWLSYPEPNTGPEGGCQEVFTGGQHHFARLCMRKEPRGVRAWRYVDSSYRVRSCQQR
jgi:hypothetical protein